MEPAWGLLYLVFCGAVVLAGLPIVILVQTRFGENDGRDAGIWGLVALAALAVVWRLAG